MKTTQETAYSTGSIIREISKKKWKYVLILAAIYSGSLLFLRYFILSYSSTATVSVIDAVKIDSKSDRNLPDYLLPTDQLNAIYRAINSSRMEEHLIQKFNLYQHYGIDTNKEFHHARVLKRLRSSISLKKSPYSTIDITVNDHFRYVAYEIANEIASYSDTLNRKFILKAQAKRVLIHRRALEQLEGMLSKKQQELKKLLVDLTASKGIFSNEAISLLNDHMYQLAGAVDRYNQGLKDEIIILETLSDVNLPTVMIQQRAIPDAQSLLLPSAFFATLFFILGCILIVSYHYLKMRYSEYFQLLKNKNNE
jgi:capsular polysaccharide biosynthesis protein